MGMAEEPLEEDRVAGLVDAGAEITGSVVGAGIGLIVAGPPGALGGAFLGPIVSRVTADFANRFLSHREQVRVGAIVRYVADEIEQQTALGRQVRQDGFFDAQPGDRGPLEEVAEAVLRAAQDEPEERKLRYLARLMAEIALRPEVDRGAAIELVRDAEDLTYRQILLLSLFGRSTEFNLRQSNYRDAPLSNVDPVVPLLNEVGDLSRRNLVGIRGGVILGLVDVIPSAIEPAGLGVWLYNTMRLGEVPREDLEPLASALAEKE